MYKRVLTIYNRTRSQPFTGIHRPTRILSSFTRQSVCSLNLNRYPKRIFCLSIYIRLSVDLRGYRDYLFISSSVYLVYYVDANPSINFSITSADSFTSPSLLTLVARFVLWYMKLLDDFFIIYSTLYDDLPWEILQLLPFWIRREIPDSTVG